MERWPKGLGVWTSGTAEEMLGDGAGECAPVEMEPSMEDLGQGVTCNLDPENFPWLPPESLGRL